MKRKIGYFIMLLPYICAAILIICGAINTYGFLLLKLVGVLFAFFSIFMILGALGAWLTGDFKDKK